MSGKLPIIVLAGSDARPGAVPHGMQADDMLTGYKGAIELPGGRCLVGELIARLRQTDRFEEPVLIGPRRVYQEKVAAEVVDVEGNLADSLRCAIEFVQSRYSPAKPVAITTCDILPTPEDVVELLESSYAPHQTCMFWMQLIAAEPAELGASRWKPSYQFRPAPDEPPQNVYPGHLVIVRPDALRLELAVHLLRIAYRYRNLPLGRRHVQTVAHGIWDLLRQDFVNLFAAQLPVLTVGIPCYGLRAFYKFQRRKITITDFELAVSRGFLHRRFHAANQRRPVVCSLTRLVSLAKDIDTQAELAEAIAVGP